MAYKVCCAYMKAKYMFSNVWYTKTQSSLDESIQQEHGTKQNTSVYILAYHNCIPYYIKGGKCILIEYMTLMSIYFKYKSIVVKLITVHISQDSQIATAMPTCCV